MPAPGRRGAPFRRPRHPRALERYAVVARLGVGYATPYLGLFREEAERCLALMPAAQGVVRWPSTRPALAALVEEDELPLTDSAVDRVLLVHALEMSSDPAELLREAWRVLAAGGRLLAVVPNRRGLWARMDTTPFGQGRPYSRTQITQLLRDTWFTPTGWGEALYVPPIPARLVPALGGGLGTHRRDAVGAVRRRPYRRGDQAGLSRHPGAARKAPARPGAPAGTGALAGRRGDAVIAARELTRETVPTRAAPPAAPRWRRASAAHGDNL